VDLLSNLRPSSTTNVDTASATDDLQLVAAVLRRDRKATAEFVSLHADGIYAYVWNRLLPGTELVEDIVQDVFLAALDSLPKFQGTSSLRSWLLGIARHKVEDYYRARLRESLSIDGDEAELLLPVEPELDEFIDRERLAHKVWQVLRSLPEAYCLALLWRYWENRSACEMAAQTGRTEKAIERLLARAREQFKRRWNDE
jgi:RNA polymerase sigma-70 factor (ECF subfamily)